MMGLDKPRDGKPPRCKQCKVRGGQGEKEKGKGKVREVGVGGHGILPLVIPSIIMRVMPWCRDRFSQVGRGLPALLQWWQGQQLHPREGPLLPRGCKPLWRVMGFLQLGKLQGKEGQSLQQFAMLVKQSGGPLSMISRHAQCMPAGQPGRPLWPRGVEGQGE